MAGVVDPRDYAIFQNKGYQGLYGGLGAKEIHARKGLKKSQKILDHMGSTELAANLFRATQTDEKLLGGNVQGKLHITRTTKSAKKSARPSKNSAEQCLKICQRRKRVSRKSNGNRKNASSEPKMMNEHYIVY